MENTLYKFFQKVNTSYLLKFIPQKTIVPLYHVISNNSVPHIQHLYPIKTINSFIKDLDYLLKYFTPISFPDFINNEKSKKKMGKPNMLLTFDDGLKEFYTVIAPILIEKGIPAICFLNSQFIDNRELFYRYKISLLIDYISENKLEKSVRELFQNECRYYINFNDFLLSIKYKDQKLLNDIANSIEFSFNFFLENDQPYLTTSQIKTLINQGFSFGAHSIDHPLYSDLTLENQLYQTKKSVNDVCSKFNLSYKAFAFPFNDNGVNQLFYNEIFNSHLVDVSFGTSGLKQDMNKKNIHRIPMEKGLKSAKSIINLEISKSIVRTILKKNNVLHF